eukprot:TRINITY_DN58750_c0_g1_i1.p1 TRINITY_DN58750_c0_g1~~TRINITY_DN58750_c0_g1_i1.p1  ORF type:complete len:596 (-),score=105.14 TRINITY_DN58750_c0_g1_i1:184-1971(-)
MLDLDETKKLIQLLQAEGMSFTAIRDTFFESFPPAKFPRLALALRCLLVDNHSLPSPDPTQSYCEILVALFLLDQMSRRQFQIPDAFVPHRVPNTVAVLFEALRLIESSFQKKRPPPTDDPVKAQARAVDRERAATALKLCLLHCATDRVTTGNRAPAFYLRLTESAMQTEFTELSRDKEHLKKALDEIRGTSEGERRASDLLVRTALAVSIRPNLPPPVSTSAPLSDPRIPPQHRLGWLPLAFADQVPDPSAPPPAVRADGSEVPTVPAADVVTDTGVQHKSPAPLLAIDRAAAWPVTHDSFYCPRVAPALPQTPVDIRLARRPLVSARHRPLAAVVPPPPLPLQPGEVAWLPSAFGADAELSWAARAGCDEQVCTMSDQLRVAASQRLDTDLANLVREGLADPSPAPPDLASFVHAVGHAAAAAEALRKAADGADGASAKDRGRETSATVRDVVLYHGATHEGAMALWDMRNPAIADAVVMALTRDPSLVGPFLAPLTSHFTFDTIQLIARVAENGVPLPPAFVDAYVTAAVERTMQTDRQQQRLVRLVCSLMSKLNEARRRPSAAVTERVVAMCKAFDSVREAQEMVRTLAS